MERESGKAGKHKKYISIALGLAVVLHFFNGYVMSGLVPLKMLNMFFYDIASLAVFILLGIAIVHWDIKTALNYKRIWTALLISVLGTSMIYAIMLIGFGSFLATGLQMHIFGIIFIFVPVVIGEYLTD